MKRLFAALVLFLAHMGSAYACMSSEQLLANAERAKIPTTVLVGPPGHVCGYMVLQECDYRILRTTLFGRTA